jgi:hypothetical protein
LTFLSEQLFRSIDMIGRRVGTEKPAGLCKL